MMRKPIASHRRRLVWRWLSIALWLNSLWIAGCAVLAPSSARAPSPLVAQGGCVVADTTLSQALALAIPGHTQPIAALSFSSDDALLHVLHAGAPGTLNTWRLGAAPQLVRQTIMHEVGRRGAQFNATGSRLAVTAGRPDTERYLFSYTAMDHLGSALTGVQIWDPTTGELLRHLWNESDRLPPPSRWTDAALSADGRLVLSVELGGFNMDDVVTNKGQCSYGRIIRNQLDQTTTAAGFAPQGGVFATGGTHGYVNLYQMGNRPGACRDLSGLMMADDEVALRLAFHPTDKRYAVLSNRSLWLAGWPASLFSHARHVVRSESLLGDLQFSPDGRWLAVASPHGLEVRSYPGLAVVASDTSISATAVAFSAANCTLAVGDSVGIVRLYALR